MSNVLRRFVFHTVERIVRAFYPIIVVRCSDPRFDSIFRKFRELYLHLGVSFVPISIPGGCAYLVENIHMLEIHIEHHGIRTVILKAHSDCAVYRQRYPDADGYTEEDRVRAQEQDMFLIRRRLLEKYPYLDIQCFYAQANPDDTVNYYQVDEEGQAESISA